MRKEKNIYTGEAWAVGKGKGLDLKLIRRCRHEIVYTNH